jgi:hypothetical protein
MLLIVSGPVPTEVNKRERSPEPALEAGMAMNLAEVDAIGVSGDGGQELDEGVARARAPGQEDQRQPGAQHARPYCSARSAHSRPVVGCGHGA